MVADSAAAHFGATRLRNPRVLVFTATVSGRTRQFVAWARPSELLRVHLSNASPQMQLAYASATARANQWALGIPNPANPQVNLPWGGVLQPPSIPPPQPQLIPEHFLLNELAVLEQSGSVPMPDLAVNVPLLHSLFTAVLRKDSVERNAPDNRWRDAILGDTDDYLAVTEHGTYVALVSRQAAVNAVLRSLIPAEPRPSTPRTRV